MAFSVWLAAANRSAGTYQIASRAVPAGLTRASARLTSTSWTQAGRTITLSLEASLDGGATWVPFGAARFAGGSVSLKDGVTAGFRQFDVTLDPEAYPTHVRGTVVVAGGAVNCGVSGELA
jgi:hypothetical protein